MTLPDESQKSSLISCGLLLERRSVNVEKTVVLMILKTLSTRNRSLKEVPDTTLKEQSPFDAFSVYAKSAQAVLCHLKIKLAWETSCLNLRPRLVPFTTTKMTMSSTLRPRWIGIESTPKKRRQMGLHRHKAAKNNLLPLRNRQRKIVEPTFNVIRRTSKHSKMKIKTFKFSFNLIRILAGAYLNSLWEVKTSDWQYLAKSS